MGGRRGARLNPDLYRRVVEDSAFRALVLGSPDEATSMFGLTDEQRELAQHIAVLRGYPIFQNVPADEIALLVEMWLDDRRARMQS